MTQFSAELDRFISYGKNLKNLSAASVKAYSKDISQFISWLAGENLDICKPEKNTGRAYVVYLMDNKLKPVSINRKLTALRVFYDYLIKTKICTFNPFERVKSLRKDKVLPEYLQYSEINMLGAAIEESGSVTEKECEVSLFTKLRNKALIDFLYSTGCRVSEAVKLDIGMIDFKNGNARVFGKGSKERIVYLGIKAMNSLKKYIDYLGYRATIENKKLPVFLNNKRKRITERGIFYIIEKMGETANIGKKVFPHIFRHSFATHLVSEGADIRYVQEMLGHGSLSTTQVYTHLGIGRLKNVYRGSHPHGAMHLQKISQLHGDREKKGAINGV